MNLLDNCTWMQELTASANRKGGTAMKQSWMMALGMFVGVAALAMAGCQGDGGGELGAQARSPLPDVPLPDGFSLVELRSRSWRSGESRFVDHLYEGRRDKFAVSRFYEKQMPLSGWSMESSQFLQGRGTMDFVKGAERCRITYYDSGLGETAILIAIWPMDRGGVPT
jgi:hypothetical protein